jgi:hypothetical protein
LIARNQTTRQRTAAGGHGGVEQQAVGGKQSHEGPVVADFVAEVAREYGLSCRSGFSKVGATCSCRSLQLERRL